MSKALTPRAVGNLTSGAAVSAPASTPQPVNLSPTSLLIMPHLTPTIDERAVNFFFSNHVVGIDVPSRGFIDHMHAHPDYELGDNLLSSIKAVGLAGFSNAAKAPGLMVEAKKQYTSAVRHLNAALQSPVEVKKDSTLLAVMVLGIFETLAGKSENSLTAWAAHLNGAAALMKIRGPPQMATVAGRRLYGQITASLATSCLQQEIELPDHILELREELDKYVDINNLAWQNHHVLMQFTNFFAKVQKGKITNLQIILDRALELDNKLALIFSHVTQDWTFSILYTNDDPEVVYHGYYHVYQHALSAMMWNGMRTMRIMLNEIIRNMLLRGFLAKPPMFFDRKHTEQLQKSTDTLYQVSSDIIASVPQYLGYTSASNIPSPHSPFGSPEPLRRRKTGPWSESVSVNQYSPWDSVQASVPLLRTAGYQLPWALFLVGVTEMVTEPVLRWVIKTLGRVRDVLGIQQANVLAERLERTRLPSFTRKA